MKKSLFFASVMLISNNMRATSIDMINLNIAVNLDVVVQKEQLDLTYFKTFEVSNQSNVTVGIFYAPIATEDYFSADIILKGEKKTWGNFFRDKVVAITTSAGVFALGLDLNPLQYKLLYFNDNIPIELETFENNIYLTGFSIIVNADGSLTVIPK